MTVYCLPIAVVINLPKAVLAAGIAKWKKLAHIFVSGCCGLLAYLADLLICFYQMFVLQYNFHLDCCGVCHIIILHSYFEMSWLGTLSEKCVGLGLTIRLDLIPQKDKESKHADKEEVWISCYLHQYIFP